MTNRNNHNHAMLLSKDIDAKFPVTCEGDGGGAVSFMMRNAPTVIISRNTKLANRIVPVFFISCRSGAENRSQELLGDIYEGSGRMAILRHVFKGGGLGGCLVIPFLYHLQPSARQFCSGIERYLNSKKSSLDIAWQLESCFVEIFHGGNQYVPSITTESLTS